MSDKWHGGKGDKSRVSDPKKYSVGMERIYGRKSWQFWAVWDGFDIEGLEFDDSGLKDNEQISYREFMKRLKSK
jgi:hypothetical protein